MMTEGPAKRERSGRGSSLRSAALVMVKDSRARERFRVPCYVCGMALALPDTPTDRVVTQPEQRMLIHGVSWKDYVTLREALDTPGLRMTYCEGVLELMSPSREHEVWKKMAARLIELYAFLRNLPLLGYGSTTFRREAKERGSEPDECWNVGTPMPEGGMPQIVLEVIALSPLLDKLRVYDGFAIPEVWIWKDGAFAIHLREPAGGYRLAERSALLPDLDFDLVARFVKREDQHTALNEFAAIVRETLTESA
jgi:Uma2 family endonuclease